MVQKSARRITRLAILGRALPEALLPPGSSYRSARRRVETYGRDAARISSVFTGRSVFGAAISRCRWRAIGMSTLFAKANDAWIDAVPTWYPGLQAALAEPCGGS